MSLRKKPSEKIGNIAPFGLRMLPDLRDKIENAAAENGRSMNAEIIARLEQSFDPLIVNIRNGSDMMDEIAKIAENVVKKIRDDERKAGIPPMDYDPND